MSTWSRRIGAASGLLWIVCILVGNSILDGIPDVSSDEQPALWITQIADQPALAVLGGVLEAVGQLLSLVFAAFLASVLIAADAARSWLARLAFGAMAVAVAVKIATVAPFVAALDLADEKLEDPVAAGLLATGDAGFHLAMLPLGLFVLSVSAASWPTRSLPAWLGWSGLVVGIALLFSGTAGIALENVIGILVMFVWVIAVSAWLLLTTARD